MVTIARCMLKLSCEEHSQYTRTFSISYVVIFKITCAEAQEHRDQGRLLSAIVSSRGHQKDLGKTRCSREFFSSGSDRKHGISRGEERRRATIYEIKKK